VLREAEPLFSQELSDLASESRNVLQCGATLGKKRALYAIDFITFALLNRSTPLQGSAIAD